jgi:hypothetical protein
MEPRELKKARAKERYHAKKLLAAEAARIEAEKKAKEMSVLPQVVRRAEAPVIIDFK